MSLDALRYLQDYNARYSGTRANQALVDLLVGRAQQERALQEANARLAQTQAFQSQLQREHLAGMQKNALGELQAREKYKTDALASRNEAIKPVVNEMMATEARLNALTRSDEIRREGEADKYAERVVLSQFPEAAKLKSADSKISLLQALTSGSSQLSPQKRAEIQDVLGKAKSAFLADPRLGVSQSAQTEIKGLQTRLRYLDEALRSHVAAGGTLPSINPIDELAARPASSGDFALPETKTSNSVEAYGPPPPDEIKGALRGVFDQIQDRAKGNIIPVWNAILNGLKQATFGGSRLPTDETALTSAQKQAVASQVPAGYVAGQGFSFPYALRGSAPNYDVPIPPGFNSTPNQMNYVAGQGFAFPAAPSIAPQFAPVSSSSSYDVPLPPGYQPSPEFVPDALRPSTISPPIGFIGYP